MEPLLGVSWTLTHEGLFYAAFGLALLHARFGVLAFLLWGLAILADVAGYWGELGWPIAILRPYNLEFMMGMVAAIWVRHRPLPSPTWGLWLGGTLFLIGGWLEYQDLLNAHGLMARVVYGPAAVLLVVAAAAVTAKPGVWWMRLGSASYSIYLFQFILIGIAWQALLVLRLEGLVSSGFIFVLLVATAVGGGVGISTWIEGPLLKRLSGRRALRLQAEAREGASGHSGSR
jgi:peptidoglycan/LPS O-acetylase OafA/YrhL